MNRDIFLKAFALVSNPETWTRHHLAGDENNYSVAIDDPLACKFCSIGAIAHTLIVNSNETYSNKQSIFSNSIITDFMAWFQNNYNVSIIKINDSLGYAATLDAWKAYGEAHGYFD